MKAYLFKTIFRIFDSMVEHRLQKVSDLKVLQGPFEGMKYVRGAVGSSYLPKILGTYEMELSNWIQSLPEFPVALDVGAAEGYYAVGLVSSGICKSAIAWEMCPDGRALLHELACQNGVEESVSIRPKCSPEELKQYIGKEQAPILLVVDCEGFEKDLFEYLDRGDMQRCWMLIETHEPMVPGVHDFICERLAETHELDVVTPRRRTPDDLPDSLPKPLEMLKLEKMGRLGMSERRNPGIEWVLAKPK